MDPATLIAEFTSPGAIALDIGGLQVRWYGLLIASALILGVNLSQWLAVRRKVNPEQISDLAIWLVIAALVGARLYYVAFQWPEYAAQPLKIFAIWEGGIAIHGAILGGILATWLFAKWQQLSFWQLGDLVIPSLSLGQAIGRWGNFFNSEAFGAPTDLPWKLLIPPDRRPPKLAEFAYYHPTFLYESLWNLMVLGLLLTLFFKQERQPNRYKVGTLTLVYAIAYSLGRFWIEWLRTDSLMLGSLKMAQVISLVGIATGAIGLFWLYKRKNPKGEPLGK
ncbi:MAG: prolipoprotein diacylglyceryl transferase [Synechococcales bacterium]|nr:prolipoprotein diacylglyceryl transferase [Synechococcales bacterium]